MFSNNAGTATHAYDAACTCPRCAHSASNSACRCDACAAVPSAPAWLYRQGDRVVVWGNKGSDAPRVGVIVQCRRIRTVKDGYVGRLPMYDVRIVSTVLQCVSPDQMALAPRVDRFYQGQYVRLLCRSRGIVCGTVARVHGNDGDASTFRYDVRATDGTVYMAVRCEGLEAAMV